MDEAMKIHRIETAFFAIGLTLLAVWWTARIYMASTSQESMARFRARERETASDRPALRAAFGLGSGATTAQATYGQKTEFAADMRLVDAAGRTQAVKLFVGNQRARLDRAPISGELNGISSLLIDFDHQFLYLLAPRSKMYMRLAGSNGTPFYRGAWMFRPSSLEAPCGGWVSEANQRGITLRCQQAGQDDVGGRPTQKWDAVIPDGSRGSVWYDPTLNFIVKVLRISKNGTQSGYELQEIKEGTQPQKLFDPPSGYREFTLNRLMDILVDLNQW
jgi:hypothetical protein